MQHAISSQAVSIWQLLSVTETDLPTSVYVCGAGNMSRHVRLVFETMAHNFGAVQSKRRIAELYLWTDERETL